MVSWCSGYHACLTRRRSPVRSRPRSRVSRAVKRRTPSGHTVLQYPVSVSWC
uniref:Uncharacterized protein n=1 Tax=Ascaris lumbricoides TaxID=6252 RepID=A0A0M3HK40_ASCLU